MAPQHACAAQGCANIELYQRLFNNASSFSSRRSFFIFSLPMNPMNLKRLSFIAVTERAIAFLPVLL
jgi:hypothetical protein